MRKIFTALTLLAAALYAADPVREQTLQRAIDLMESKGDLAKAMPLFEDAARSADKALAARALLYLGQGQERQGADKARATYERVVREFAGQTDSVAVARKRLAALGSNASNQTITKRLVCDVCGDGEADISPDGRQLVITDWDTGDLAIRDIQTGDLKRLMVKPNSWRESGAYAETPEFSPDARQIAYLWENEDDTTELRLVATEPRSKARTLLKSNEYTWYEPFAWSKDSKSVFVILTRPDRSWQIAVASTVDGKVQVLKSLGWRLRPPRAGKPSLSPDGRYIAYSALAVNPSSATAAASSEKRIYVLSVDGSGETELVKTAGINDSPVWTPDGAHLLFSSDRFGSFGLWSIAVQNGKAAGSPALVMADTGRLTPNGILRHSLYYTGDRTGNVETVRIMQAGRSAPLSDSIAGMLPRWSPDGKQIALLRPRPSGAGDTFDLVVHTLETGEETIYSSPGTRQWVRWFPDGKALQAHVVPDDPKGTRGVYRVDLQTKEFKLLQAFGPSDLAGGISVLSPDQRTLYIAGREPGKSNEFNRIEAIEGATGNRRVVTSFPAVPAFEIQLSPDGRTLAIRRTVSNRDTRYSTVAVNGTGFRDLRSGIGAHQLAWSADSRAIFFAQEVEEEKTWQLMRLPVDGGKAEPVGIEGTGMNFRGMNVSPDGTKLLFSARRPFQELWAIDNIASVLK